MDNSVRDVKKSVRWTSDQEAAIRSRNANLLVSAAAGSGKTAVLVERILTLITEDLIPIQNMLIVTFTNAAAGEMRTRLIKALSLRMREPDADVTWLRTQLERVGSAYVMTLHAFCNDLVRKHFYRADVDPAFRVGDATLLRALRQTAVEDTLESAYESLDPSFVHFVESFSGNRTDQKLVDLLWEVHTFIQSQPEPENWLTHHTEALDISGAENSVWLKSLLNAIVEELGGVIDAHREAEAICLDPSGPEAYLPAIQSDLEKLEHLRDAITEGYVQGWETLESFSLERLKPIRGAQAETVSGILKAGVTERREHVKKYADRLKKHFFSQNPENLDESIHKLLPSTRVLSKLVMALDLQYRTLKKDANVLDFYDLEHLAIEILKDPEISGMYRDKFQYIFLDEYQDSNLVQETVIQAIARENNVFLVGDVKQSIYKFRLADPTLFQNKLRCYSRAPESMNRIIDLSFNFRTRPELLARINGFFNRVMTMSLGEVIYDAHARLNPGTAFPAETLPSLSLTVIDTQTGKAAGSEEKYKAYGDIDNVDAGRDSERESDRDDSLVYMKNAELEAHIVAEMIRETMKQPIYDPKIAKMRKPTYRDIVILMRSPKSAATVYLDVLGEYGIPVRADGAGAKLEAFEMQVAMSLLRVIDNNHRDLDLLTVLHSPVGGFNVDSLVTLRQAYPEPGFRQAVDQYIDRVFSPDGTETRTKSERTLADRLKIFLGKIDRWADYASHEKLGDFVWRLLMETNLLDYARAMPGGSIRADHLLKLADRAKDYEIMIRGDLGGWIKTLEQSEESDMGIEIPKTLGEDEDYIRIMSVHKSKGLEFPIVFLSDTGKQFNMRDTFGDLLLHKDLGIALKEVDPERRVYRTSLPQLAIQKAIENEALSEELRILYVALTRAVDRLYVTGSTRQSERAVARWKHGCTPFAMKRARTPLDWMAAFAVGEEGNPSESWDWRVVNAADVLRGQNTTLKSYPYLEDVLQCADIEMLSPELLKRLKGPDAPQQRLLPAKVSVTELKTLDAMNYRQKDRNTVLEALYHPQLNETPKFMTPEDRSARGAARGNAFHIILQNLSFERMFECNAVQQETLFEEERAQLIYEKRLEAEVANEINWGHLKGFFDHPMFRRLMSATEYAREKPFVLRRGYGADFTMIQGIVDLYFTEPEGLVLIDYKTDRLEGKQSVQILKERYGMQLKLYAEALSALKGKPVVSAWIYASSGGRWIEIELDAAMEEGEV